MKSLSSSLMFLSKMGLLGLIVTVSLGVNLKDNKLTISPISPVYAQTACNTVQNVTFSGRTSGSMNRKPNIKTNLRAHPFTSASILATIPANTMLNFSGWTYGTGVNDLWTGRLDQRWFRVTYQGRTGWIASGVIYGNPPNAPLACSDPGAGQTGAMHRNSEAFYQWARGQVGIRRLDPRMEGLRGQCVTLIARYIQEVYLTGSQRTTSIAFGHGKDTASVVASRWPSLFTPVTTQGLPRRGAVISFPDIGRGYGHVAIVMEAKQLSNGQRQVRILDSNSDSLAVNSTVKEHTRWIDIPNGRVQGYGRGIYWTNPR